jgi:DNA-binding transcriptional LysR family regulator
MRFDQLITFRCVADERSYTRAAERLFMTQSAVYQQIRQLEHETGTKLCYVLGKEVQLTVAGRVVYEFAVAVGQLHEKLQKRLRELHEQNRRVVRIAAASYFGLLPMVAERLAARYPGIMIEFWSLAPRKAVECIRTGEVDFGFFGLAYVPGDLEAEPCFEQRIVIAVPADHELARRDALRFSDLSSYSFVGYIDGSARTAIEAWKRGRPDVEIRYAALGDSSLGIKTMALAMNLPAFVAEAAI